MRFVSRLLDLQLKRSPLLQPLSAHLLGCFQRRLDGVPADGVQYLIGDGLIRP
jgi:hypothetical protein